MARVKVTHDHPPGSVVRLLRPLLRRGPDGRPGVALEPGLLLTITAADGEYAGVAMYKAKDADGREWGGVLAAWVEPAGGPAPADSLFG